MQTCSTEESLCPTGERKRWQRADLDEQQMADLKKFGSVDFAYDYDDNTRFRVNLFQARGKISVAARRITSRVPCDGTADTTQSAVANASSRDVVGVNAGGNITSAK